MTGSEFAFLALGLALGVASGSALVMVLVSRPPAREVRLTVEHDAVPRRAATLSADAFSPSSAEVARGGPADRRLLDRDPAPSDGPGQAGFEAQGDPPSPVPNRPFTRTPVPSGAPGPAAVGIPIVPERDGALAALRVGPGPGSGWLRQTDPPTASTVLDPRSTRSSAIAAPMTATIAVPGTSPLPADETQVDETPAVMRILRGDYRALLACTVTLALDDAERRRWHVALMGLADAVAREAVAVGWLDFPVGNPFWDTFTTAQCREIAGALAAAGFLFDGVDGWEDGRVPAYRDLAAAVAAAGLEPRRIRAWPTQEEISRAYSEVTVAGDDFLAAVAPELDLETVVALVGQDLPEGPRLWTDWDRVRAVLLSPLARGSDGSPARDGAAGVRHPRDRVIQGKARQWRLTPWAPDPRPRPRR
jgi:hypothetical protein